MNKERTFDQIVGTSGESLIVTIPRPTCKVLNLKKGDLVKVILLLEKNKK